MADKEETLADENERLKAWVSDLQSGTYINCVYCGHCYGPDTAVAASMADVLKEHVEHCPEHPLFAAMAQIALLKEDLAETRERRKLVEGNGWDVDKLAGPVYELWQDCVVNDRLEESDIFYGGFVAGWRAALGVEQPRSELPEDGYLEETL